MDKENPWEDLINKIKSDDNDIDLSSEDIELNLKEINESFDLSKQNYSNKDKKNKEAK